MTNKTMTLYTGMTNNIERRTAEHKSHSIPGFTSHYKISKLVYCEEFNDVHDAIAREKQIKGWTRQKKIDLITSTNPEWKDVGLR
jgi:putative endonuclease